MKKTKIKNESLLQLQSWFNSQCNGQWEHNFGIKIDTLDNPGWQVIIDLKNTKLEDVSISPMVREISDKDWVNCSVSNNKFKGYGGVSNLEEILDIFFKFQQE